MATQQSKNRKKQYRKGNALERYEPRRSQPELERGVRTCCGDAHKEDGTLSLTMGLATAWGGSQTSFWGSTGAECLPRSVMVQRPLRPLFWCPTVSAPYQPNPDATTARKDTMRGAWEAPAAVYARRSNG
ncbi:hypothetical protein C8J57DRAFT_1242735 [Mycena rebaudengoi]|nr:hypothetical protein C8J57DRAFT_1242735 [Mycena rebaudengoi]